MSRLDNSLYFGQVRHARYQPRAHRFTYRVFSALLDVDRLDAGEKPCRLFSIDQFNLFAFYRRDHGPKDGSKLRPFIEELLRDHQHAAPEQIMILCYPRLLGYVFNPLTVYYCLRDGQITALVYEVRNTFGDDHIYVVPCNNATPALGHSRDKLMHVSPFIGMAATYHFSTSHPDDKLRLVIRETEEQKPLLVASFIGTRKAMTGRNLFAAFFRYPLMTMKIVAAIHFEAARLFLKGVPVFRRPAAPNNRISY